MSRTLNRKLIPRKNISLGEGTKERKRKQEINLAICITESKRIIIEPWISRNIAMRLEFLE